MNYQEPLQFYNLNFDDYALMPSLDDAPDAASSLSSSFSSLLHDESWMPQEYHQHLHWQKMSQDCLMTEVPPLHYSDPYHMPYYHSAELMSASMEPQTRMFSCGWLNCPVRTETLDQLIVHVRDVHVGSGKPAYYCHWVGCPRNRKPFTKRHKMHNHMRTHTGERPFECTISGCNKRFSRPDSLSTHIKTHSNVRPYPCRVPGCNKAYFHSRSLRKHTKSHEEAKRVALNTQPIDVPRPNALSHMPHTMLMSSLNQPVWP